MTKNAERREKFRKIGQAISSLGSGYDGRDYTSGKFSDFKIKCKAIQDKDVTSRFPDGPVMKSQQWERTVRR